MAKKKIKTAVVNGVKISPQAVQFELDRLIKFYAEHGVSAEEVRGCMSLLRDKALEQAIGAKLLLERAEQLDIPLTASDIDAEVEKVISQVGGRENYEAALAAQGVTEKDFRRELEKGAKVNKLVEQACSSVPEPTESEAEAFFAAHITNRQAKHSSMCAIPCAIFCVIKRAAKRWMRLWPSCAQKRKSSMSRMMMNVAAAATRTITHID